MTWVKLDDQFPEDDKVLDAGMEAAGFYVCGLCYCARQMTDGFIPQKALNRVADVKRPVRLAEKLVASGLWAEVEGGWQVPNYLRYNPSAAEINARREKDRAKKQTQRRGDDGQFVPEGVPEGHDADSPGESPKESDGPVPSPTRPDPSPPPSPPVEGEDFVGQVVRRLAERQADMTTIRHSRDGYIKTRLGPLRLEHEPMIRRLMADAPNATTEDVMRCLAGEKPLRVVRDPCEKCEDTGVWLDELAEAHDCECKGRRSA